MTKEKLQEIIDLKNKIDYYEAKIIEIDKLINYKDSKIHLTDDINVAVTVPIENREQILLILKSTYKNMLFDLQECFKEM